MMPPKYLRNTGALNQGRVVDELVQFELLDMAGAHGGESIDDSCPVPSAGMIRIRFNGFANRHLRL
jgi:hypothetical protein